MNREPVLRCEYCGRSEGCRWVNVDQTVCTDCVEPVDVITPSNRGTVLMPKRSPPKGELRVHFVWRSYPPSRLDIAMAEAAIYTHLKRRGLKARFDSHRLDAT